MSTYQAAQARIDWSFITERGLQLFVAAICAALVLVPLVPLFIQSFIDRPLYDSGWQFSLAGYHLLFTSPDVAQVTWNTLYFTVLSSTLSLIIGIGSAIIIGRTNLPFADWIYSFARWPIYISAIVLAIGWTIVYGPSGYITILLRSAGLSSWNLYSLEGIALVSAISHAPVTLIYAIGSVRQQDSTLENAALISGAGPAQVLAKITLPLMRPAIIFCIIMNVVTSLESFAIPLVLGGPHGIDLIASYIFRAGFSAITPNYTLVAAAAVCLVAVISMMTILQLMLLQKMSRFTTVVGKVARQNKFDLGSARWPMFGVFAIYIAVFILIPIAGVFARAFTNFLTPLMPITSTLTLSNFHQIFSEAGYVRAITNTLIIAGFGGAISTVVITLIVFVAHRSNFPGRVMIDFLVQFPRAIPGLLTGLGLFYAAALLPGGGWLMGTLWILIIAYTMRFLPNGYSIIAPAVMALSKDLDKAANTMGASWLTVCQRIVTPLIKMSIFNCYSILFIFSIKEYAAAIFLYRQGTEVMGSVLLSFWAQGDSGPVAALAVLQIAIVSIYVFFSGRLMEGHERG